MPRVAFTEGKRGFNFDFFIHAPSLSHSFTLSLSLSLSHFHKHTHKQKNSFSVYFCFCFTPTIAFSVHFFSLLHLSNTQKHLHIRMSIAFTHPYIYFVSSSQSRKNTRKNTFFPYSQQISQLKIP